MAIAIRAATAQDYDDLCALIDEVDALHRDNLGHLFQKPGGPIRDKDYILGLIADEDVGLFVAEAVGVVIGLVHVAVCESPPIPIFVPRRYAVVENLVVGQGFRQAGVGRALMEQAHQWAGAQGAAEVELTVYDFNEAARAFYESLGYETRSRHMCKLVQQDTP
jgi:ribosomal protein S18 acetylase RimI-like enzyme